MSTKTNPHVLPAPSRRRRIRMNAGWTRPEVAAHLGVSVESVRLWESGRTPGIDNYSRYARFLKSIS